MRMINMMAVAGVVLVAGIAWGESLAEASKSFVRNEWKNISKVSEKGTELRDEWLRLPESAWFRKDRKSQNKVIARHLKSARELLLSTSSKKLLKNVDKLDEKIADTVREIAECREELITSPEKKEELEKKINALDTKRTALETSRKAELDKFIVELQGIGLKLTEQQAQTFFSSVTANTLIDNTVVARNIALITENLRQLMDTKDIATAKRYYGMYIEMIEIQIECFRQYREETDEKWVPGVEAIIADAKRAQQHAQMGLQSADYTPEQKQIFSNNIKLNGSVIKAAELYRKMLTEQAAVIDAKREKAIRIRNTAFNSFETVRVAGELSSIMRTSKNSFDAILQMEIPTLAAFDDAEMQEQFAEITRQLSER
ncbi:MAG: hypothetical protein J6334_06540 [Kiritimatiellae bacterium]|nr:hypothetical protein [Kiritimatiellia bacterium]